MSEEWVQPSRLTSPCLYNAEPFTLPVPEYCRMMTYFSLRILSRNGCGRHQATLTDSWHDSARDETRHCKAPKSAHCDKPCGTWREKEIASRQFINDRRGYFYCNKRSWYPRTGTCEILLSNLPSSLKCLLCFVNNGCPQFEGFSR